ncbi:DNA primase [Pararheinheimera phage vB_PsoM_KLER1-1]|nr:DNA primase [Pararheinheimera phage vB_PsoM_KLER1-1]
MPLSPDVPFALSTAGQAASVQCLSIFLSLLSSTSQQEAPLMPMSNQQMLDAFLDILSDNGIRLEDPSSILLDGEKHRAIVEGDNKSNLVYQVFPDDRPAGWFDYYKGGVSDTFTLGDSTPLTDSERAALQQKMQAEKQRRNLEKQRMHEQRAAYIQQLWASAKSVTGHPYLTKKQITDATGIRLLDSVNMAEFMDDPDNTSTIRNALLVPVYHIDAAKTTLESAQIIEPSGRKLFAKNARMHGNCHIIRGTSSDYFIITEGYATGKALAAATGQTVIVCMYAGNMAAVACSIKDRWPERTIIYAPDNDWSLPLQQPPKDNAGLMGAAQADASVPGPVVAPEFPADADTSHTDWDDWVRHYGTIEQVAELFSAAYQSVQQQPESELDEPDEDDPLSDAPFRMLGHDGERYYYLDNEGLRVRAVPAAGHTRSQLVVIADSDWWMRRYPVKNKDGRVTGVAWERAGNDLLRSQHRIGIYDTDRLRGRGAWFDAGRSVLHMGNRLIVDGLPFSIRDFQTDYIYESGKAYDLTAGQSPLVPSRLTRLSELVQMLSWDAPVYSELMLGWCVAAVICGALPWRPHIWLTGPSGSGKSWVYDSLMKPLVDDHWAVLAQSATTEAGIRQKLRLDARPVMFDEAEGEDKTARQRMQNVLELVRQASSETGAPIVKGSRDGDAVEYRIRSCFAFSSINVTAKMAADVSRITVLQLHKNESATATDHFDRIKRLRTELMTPEFCQQFRATAVASIPRIMAAHEIMTRAAAEHFGSRREGDQIGTLLVCYWALTTPSSQAMTVDLARDYLSSRTWPSDITPGDEDNDHERCLSEIMATMMRIDVESAGISTSVNRTVAEVVNIAASINTTGEVRGLNAKCAERNLRRHGMGVYNGMLHISESHPSIRRMLSDSPWGGSWGKVLGRIKGSVKKPAFRFSEGKGGATRAIAIPITFGQSNLMDDETAF